MARIKRLEDIEGPATIVGCVIGSKSNTLAYRKVVDSLTNDLTKYNRRRFRESEKLRKSEQYNLVAA